MGYKPGNVSLEMPWRKGIKSKCKGPEVGINEMDISKER